MTESIALNDLAYDLLKTNDEDPNFINAVLMSLDGLDEGSKIRWCDIHESNSARKAFRAFLKALGLLETERKILQNGGTVFLAFIKDDGRRDENLYDQCKRVLERALERLLLEQIREIKHSSADSGALRIVAASTEAMPGDEVPNHQPSTTTAQGGEDSSPPAPTLFETYKAYEKKDLESVTRYEQSRKLEEGLWGLSERKQSKIRRKIDELNRGEEHQRTLDFNAQDA